MQKGNILNPLKRQFVFTFYKGRLQRAMWSDFFTTIEQFNNFKMFLFANLEYCFFRTAPQKMFECFFNVLDSRNLDFRIRKSKSGPKKMLELITLIDGPLETWWRGGGTWNFQFAGYRRALLLNQSYWDWKPVEKCLHLLKGKVQKQNISWVF